MATNPRRTLTPQSGENKETGTSRDRAGAAADDACRCKETSKMSPRELWGLMMKDLAFWKRTKKE